MPTATRTFPQVSAPLAQRIAFPTPAARQSRADLRRQLAAKDARIKLRKMQERIAALRADQNALRQLTEVAEQAAPIMTDESSWRGDIPELADKIQRESRGLLEATEAPVRNADRNLVLRGLPPGVEIARDDVRYTK